MKILTLHVDYIKFKPKKKAIKSAESLPAGEEKESLVVFIAVEKGDHNSKELVKNIKDIAKQVKTKKIVLYPYAHLSSNLSSPDTALKILKDAEKQLKKDKFKITRAPFGMYKEFELKCKGHPLAELSREFSELGEEKLTENERKNLLSQVSRSRLDTSKLKENDHRILGQKMDLFSFNDVAPGMVFWHNNGLILYNELIKYWREEHKKEGYEEISTPQILDKKLWQISGHWDKYKENNFVTQYEKRPFLVKPMNCPGGMLLYKLKPRSYKELPMKVGEIGVVHRQELSGVLTGLFRVVRITQDDAHIFCADEKQVEQEVEGIIKLIDKFYKTFNLKFDHVELSTRPKKRIGTEKQWDMAENILEKVLKKKKMKYKINKGDGAFYGPKIDFHAKDSQERTWQLSTIQLDFAMPERFELEYTDKDNKTKRPIMLHRVIYGAIERFLGVLLESSNGHLPIWLAPIQCRLISFTSKNKKAVQKIENEMIEKGIRVDVDIENNTVSSKIKKAEEMKIPYIIVIGDKEEKSKSLAVRNKGKIKTIKQDKFIKDLLKEIKERK